MSDDTKGVSRRDLLKRAGLAGAALTIPVTPASPADDQARPAAAAPPATEAPKREPIENLTQAEADMLEAICARIIPTDKNGPGAREARAAHYIDRALGGALSNQREAYRTGLSSLDRYAQTSRGKRFHELPPTDQDSILIDVENGSATPGIFAGGSAGFFTMVRGHVMQGMFGDPYYGGNYNFIGWDLINYPGVRTSVTPTNQSDLEKNVLKPNHKSAYDTDMFTKATVSIDPSHDHKGMTHGDKA